MFIRLLLVAVLLAPLALAQQTAAFGKSMLVRNNEDGKTEKIKGLLRVTPDGITFEGKKRGQVFEATYSDISKLIYERTKKPRYSAGLLLAWPLLFTKEKQHYLTVEADGSFAFVKMHKSEFRPAIAAIESSSGLEVERLEE